MIDDWMAAYDDTDDLNEQYHILRREMTRLRSELVSEYEGNEVDITDVPEYFDPEAVEATVRKLNDNVGAALIVFAANDFGLPVAFRPAGLSLRVQDEVRREILRKKYDEETEHLKEIRDEILDRHPGIHKIIVAEYGHQAIQYFLPEGSNTTTNFLTVREMVGLIDYTTNSFQREGLSMTY